MTDISYSRLTYFSITASNQTGGGDSAFRDLMLFEKVKQYYTTCWYGECEDRNRWKQKTIAPGEPFLRRALAILHGSRRTIFHIFLHFPEGKGEPEAILFNMAEY